MYKKQQSGRSMIEMVGVLAVMGLITAGAFVLISSANSSSRRNRVIDDIMNIAAAVRSVYADHETFPTIDSATIWKVSGRTDATGPYTGSSYVISASGTQFTIKLKGMPDEIDCNALNTKQWKDAVSKTCNKSDKEGQYFSVTFNK